MEEVDQLKARVAILEAALMTKESGAYDIIVVRKPEPLPPRKWTGFWNVYASKARCHAHVHTSKNAADNAAFPRSRLACIKVEWEEGMTEGRWVCVMNSEE